MKSREGINLPGERKTHPSSDISQSKTPVLEDGRASYKTQGSGQNLVKSTFILEDSPIRKINRAPTKEDIEAQLDENRSIKAHLEQVNEQHMEDTSRTFERDQIKELLDNKENKVHSMSNLSESLKEIDVTPLVGKESGISFKSPKNKANGGLVGKDTGKTGIFATHDGSTPSSHAKSLLKKASSIHLSEGDQSSKLLKETSQASKQSERKANGSINMPENLSQITSGGNMSKETPRGRATEATKPKNTSTGSTSKQPSVTAAKPVAKDLKAGSSRKQPEKLTSTHTKGKASVGNKVRLI